MPPPISAVPKSLLRLGSSPGGHQRQNPIPNTTTTASKTTSAPQRIILRTISFFYRPGGIMHSTRVIEHGAPEAEKTGRVVFVSLANEPGSRDVYISGGRTRPPAEGSTRRRLVDGGTHKEAATRDNPATAPRGRHLRGRPVGRERRGVSSAGELAGGA